MLDEAERAQAYNDTIAVQSEWMQGQREHARRLARECVERWPGYFAHLEQFTQEQLVFRIDACRGDRKWSDEQVHISHEEEMLTQAFLLARYEPQHIAGIATLFPGLHVIQDALARAIPETPDVPA